MFAEIWSWYNSSIYLESVTLSSVTLSQILGTAECQYNLILLFLDFFPILNEAGYLNYSKWDTYIVCVYIRMYRYRFTATVPVGVSLQIFVLLRTLLPKNRVIFPNTYFYISIMRVLNIILRNHNRYTKWNILLNKIFCSYK